MDFIMTWVNGNDPQWKKIFKENSLKYKGDKREARFRDWENLQYWFRGVEKFAPWVDKIHFVTFGHVPEWLNLNHPKLNVVKHSDFMPADYLPTFNSRAIELNFHRIKELSEEYVYFNDDIFIIDKLEPKFFFKQGKICDMAICNALSGGEFAKTQLENIEVINKHFNKRNAIKKNILNWLNPKYKKLLLRTIFLLPWPRHTGFYNHHLSQPNLKSTLKLLWEKEHEKLDLVGKCHFRDYRSLNPYIQRYWELASNNFHPYNMHNYGQYFELADCSIEKITDSIRRQRKSIIAFNDQDVENFKDVKDEINKALQKVLPSKSEFEI